MLFYYISKNVGSVIMSHTPTFIVEPLLLSDVQKRCILENRVHRFWLYLNTTTSRLPVRSMLLILLLYLFFPMEDQGRFFRSGRKQPFVCRLVF